MGFGRRRREIALSAIASRTDLDMSRYSPWRVDRNATTTISISFLNHLGDGGLFFSRSETIPNFVSRLPQCVPQWWLPSCSSKISVVMQCLWSVFLSK